MASYEQTIYELIQLVKSQMRVQSLNLGGVSGEAGGSGGPPGGFIGKLPQNRVAYDTVEAAVLVTQDGIANSTRFLYANKDLLRDLWFLYPAQESYFRATNIYVPAGVTGSQNIIDMEAAPTLGTTGIGSGVWNFNAIFNVYENLGGASSSPLPSGWTGNFSVNVSRLTYSGGAIIDTASLFDAPLGTLVGNNEYTIPYVFNANSTQPAFSLSYSNGETLRFRYKVDITIPDSSHEIEIQTSTISADAAQSFQMSLPTSIMNDWSPDMAVPGVQGLEQSYNRGNSLVDNLNHIRGRLLKLETQSGIASTIVTSGSGGISDGDKGDVIVSGGGSVWIVDTNVITEAKLNLSNNTTADVSTSKHGYFPKLPASTGKYLRDDMSWQTVSGGSPGDLDSLTDVEIVSPSDTEVLTYETATSLWKNKPAGGSFTPDFSVWLPDAKPTTPNALDDEFDDASMSGSWNSFDPDGTINVEENVTGLSLTYNGNQFGSVGGRYLSHEMTDYSLYVWAKFSIVATEGGEAGLILGADLAGNPSTSAFMTLGCRRETDGSLTINLKSWTDYNTPDSTIVSVALSFNNPIYLQMLYAYQEGNPLVTCAYSLDGVEWEGIDYQDSVGFVPNELGVFGCAEVDLSGNEFVGTTVSFFRVSDQYTNPIREGNRVAMKFA